MGLSLLCVISFFLFFLFSFKFIFMGSEGQQVLNREKKYVELKREEELLYNCSIIIQNSALFSDTAAALSSPKEETPLKATS